MNHDTHTDKPARQGWSRKACSTRWAADECDICESELKQQMALDPVRMGLQNQLLKKQIVLLEKSQQYRCCPAGEEEDVPPPP